MGKKTKALLIVIFIGVFLFIQGISGAAAMEPVQIEALFPERLRSRIYFQGDFTYDVLFRLGELPSAQALNGLDVLRGNEGDLMLEETANRMEGATMLVRLLGAEQDALTGNYSHPFTDVAEWANPYIAYLYHHDLTRGVGGELYGSELPVDEKSYITFLLRALGYRDKEGEDFSWDTVEQKARQVGLLKSGEMINIYISFKRARLSDLSWRAMRLNHKAQNQPLIQCLYEKGMISKTSLEVLLKPEDRPLIERWLSLLPEMEQAFTEHREKIELPLTSKMADNDPHKYLSYILERVQIKTGVFYKGYSSELWQEENGYLFHISPRYVNTRAEDQKLFSIVDEINHTILRPGMTDYDKEKAVHDFLVNTLRYDTREQEKIPDSSFHALGALQTRTAVCQGYSELMLLLLNRAGIPCRMVVGEEINHVWNMVLLEGKPYHVDTTWNDPEREVPALLYDYFNLTDEEIRIDHIWNVEDYPPCIETEENYYRKNNLVINDKGLFIETLKNAIQNRKTEIVFKLEGFDIEKLDIVDMIYVINEDIGYVVKSFVDSSRKELQIVRLESIEYVE